MVEGEVHLDHNGNERVLRPGEQATTNTVIDTVPVKDEVAWSRNAARYTQALDALANLRKELNAVPKPGERYSTRLLDMMPENTVLYAAVPNLAASIVESNRLIEEKIQQNPALRDWFQNRREPGMNSAIEAIREFGDSWVTIAVGAGMSDKGEPVEPLVLAQLKNPAGFRAHSLTRRCRSSPVPERTGRRSTVDDPNTARRQPALPPRLQTKTSMFDQRRCWSDRRSSSSYSELPGTLGQRSSRPHFTIGLPTFIAGAGLVIAADLEKVIANKAVRNTGPNAGVNEQAMTQLGVINLKSFVLDQKDSNGTHTGRARE